MSPQSFTLHDLLLRNAQVFPDALALVAEGGEERSFSTLLERVERLAGGLTSAGLEPGDRLAVLAWNSASFFELYLACARQGFVVCPFNWRWSEEEIARMAERTEARAWVVDAANAAKAPTTATSDSVLLRASIGSSAGWDDFDDLYSEPCPRPALGPASPFCVIPTAAVDVIPRGAVLTHRNLLASSAQQIAAMDLGADDRNLLALPLFHISGLGNALCVLQAGGANVIMARFDSTAAVELIDRHRVTYVSDFPPVLAQVLDAAGEAESRLDSLRIVSGLDSPETIARLHSETGASFWTGFGQCETSGFVTFQPVRERPGASGRAGSLTRVRIVDDLDNDVNVDVAGEILVRGPVVFDGYDGQPEVTAHTFRGGWHHTGDVGRFDGEGYLWYVKRKPEKELIKPGGENVYPAEVETVVLEIESVTGVCVFGVPHPKWGEGIKAVVETNDPGLDAQTIIDHVGSRIARFKRPSFVEITDALPRDEAGLVDREATKQAWPQG